MALQMTNVLAEAAAAEEIANEIAVLYTKLIQYGEHNSDLAIDWANNTGAIITEEPNGNITGKYYSRQNVSNFNTLVDQLRKFFTSQAVTTGDYLGSLNLIAKPLG